MTCEKDKLREFEPACPIPVSDYPHVLMAHGGGGTLSHMLFEKIFVPGCSP